MGTPYAHGGLSRREYLRTKGEESHFPTDGIENLTSFLTETGFCNTTPEGMSGYTPQDVMAWEQYLDKKLTQNERRAIIILSSNYAIFHNRWSGNPVEDPTKEFLNKLLSPDTTDNTS